MIEGDVIISDNGGYINNLNGLSGLTSIGGQLVFQKLSVNQGNLAGLRNLTTIGGDFNIMQTELINLHGLENLNTIGGTFNIFDNYDLLSLDSLTGLTSVGKSLYLVNNRALPSLNGLNQLQTVGEYLYFQEEDMLEDLTGLESLTSIGMNLFLYQNYRLKNLIGLENFRQIGGGVRIEKNQSLTSLQGLEHLKTIPKYLQTEGNNALTTLQGLDSLTTIGDGSYFSGSSILNDLSGLEQLSSALGSFGIFNCGITNVKGLKSLSSVAGDFSLEYNVGLSGNLDGLQNLTSVGGNLVIENNGLTSLQGLEQLSAVGGRFGLSLNSELADLNGLDNLVSVGGDFFITANPLLDFMELNKLVSVGGLLAVAGNNSLDSLNGFEKLAAVGSIAFQGNNALKNLNGFNELTSVATNFWVQSSPQLASIKGFEKLPNIGGELLIAINAQLTDISGLGHISSIGGKIKINDNPKLSNCSIFPICSKLTTNQFSVELYNNAPGCNQTWEIFNNCKTIPVAIDVAVDNNGNCLRDSLDSPVPGAMVQLSGATHALFGATGEGGVAHFGYSDYEPFSVKLPQFPSDAWQLCTDSFYIVPTASGNSLNASFLLSPLQQCPELSVEARLPPFFRGCLVNTSMEIFAQNTGNVPAKDVRLAVVMPTGLELVTTSSPVVGQNGDTLFFATGDLPPFADTTLKMQVKTSCDAFLFGQTLCLEAFGNMENACPTNLPAHSEIKINAECSSDTVIRFVLKNIGDAATQVPHNYVLIKNADKISTTDFSLNAGESLTVTVPADGATYRMESTKLADGTRTAAALENCGGLTPGLITAFWLDKGPMAQDVACRQVVGSFDPNQKTANPSGAGDSHLLAANQPMEYTIEFQNTGTDTAFRVALYDYLPLELDAGSVRQVLASHPCAWQIRDNVLAVLFDPIALPDSNANEVASHGFFTFNIAQKKDLPNGTVINNYAGIIFDFNPTIWTNTAQHTIGEPLVLQTLEQQPPRPAIFPNPNAGTFSIELPYVATSDMTFRIIGLTGQLLKEQSTQAGSRMQTVKAGDLPAGIYFLQIVLEGKILDVEKFVKE